MFSTGSILNIGSGDVCNNVITVYGNGRSSPKLQSLRESVVPEAIHSSGDVQDLGVCHPGTRAAIQQLLMRWLEDRQAPGCFIMWIHGAGGAGKSAIMRSLANVLDTTGSVLATFFCRRHSSRTNSARFIIPTIVDQMIRLLPSLADLVECAMQEDPHLLSKALEYQAARLIVEPLAALDAPFDSIAFVILIDGLDELSSVDQQVAILKVVAFLSEHIPFSVRFLLASRAEAHIRHAFEHDASLTGRCAFLCIDEGFAADDDITIFYVDHFSAIQRAHPELRLPVDWPGRPTINQLVVKGSRQFIFAAIVVRFICDSSSVLTPPERLRIVLDNAMQDNLRPLDQLDLLYATVLQSVPKQHRSEVLGIVAIILLPGTRWATTRLLDTLLCFPPGTTLSRLRHLHSILKIPASGTEDITSFHATLPEFLFTRTRSEPFGLYVDMGVLRQDFLLQIVTASFTSAEEFTIDGCTWLRVFSPRAVDEISGNTAFRWTLLQHLLQFDGQLQSAHPFPLLAVLDRFVSYLECVTKWTDTNSYTLLRSLRQRITKETRRRFETYLFSGFPGEMLVALIAIQHRSAYPARLHGFDTFLSHPTFGLLWDAAVGIMGSKCAQEIRTLQEMDGTMGLSLLSQWIWQLQWYEGPSSKVENPGIPIFGTFGTHPSLYDLMVSEQVVRVVLKLDKLALEDFAGEAISRYSQSLHLNHRTIMRLRSYIDSKTELQWDEEDKVRLMNKAHQYLAALVPPLGRSFSETPQTLFESRIEQRVRVGASYCEDAPIVGTNTQPLGTLLQSRPSGWFQRPEEPCFTLWY